MLTIVLYSDFFMLDALKEYKWYWRIEPDVQFYCDLTYDPFVEMARNRKVYGWTMATWERGETVASLFRETSDYKERHGYTTSALWTALISASWLPWPFRWFAAWFSLRDGHGDRWNRCHYWDNFEIADLDFFRSSAYQKYYQFLDSKGGFYFERVSRNALSHSLLGSIANSTSGETPPSTPSPSPCSSPPSRSTTSRT